QIGMPWWYWWGLAGCWIVLGVLADLAAPWWLVTTATLAVGAGPSAVFQRLPRGRRRGKDGKVPADVAGREAQVLRIGFLPPLVAVTVAVALTVDADGAGHPSIEASVFVAVLILLGGPRVMAWVRADATRRAAGR